MYKIKNYLSLIKFSHTVFAMPFALIGFIIAVANFYDLEPIYSNQEIDTKLKILVLSIVDNLQLLFVIILCMIFARSAAMAFNRYLDRKFDAKNPRTAIREIPSGIITPNNALIFTIVSCALFLVTCFFINRLCFYLSPVALAVVLGYSYTKRFTPLCHLILGLGLSLAPIGAFIAVTGFFSFLPIIFSLVVLFWVSGFDIIYALQDEQFDRENKLYSMPAWLGKSKALRVSELLHVFSAGGVIVAGWYGNFGWLYWTGAAIFIGMLIYQHSIVKADNLKRVNIAFMTANGIASVVFAVFVVADLFIN
ncbi:MAG TPA: UbiA-like polyprenyltransferase [Chitinophagaceae bacterium]|nr:UbiA-like polyprenyltransferase [Chitinophagaceae bacterium]